MVQAEHTNVFVPKSLVRFCTQHGQHTKKKPCCGFRTPLHPKNDVASCKWVMSSYTYGLCITRKELVRSVGASNPSVYVLCVGGIPKKVSKLPQTVYKNEENQGHIHDLLYLVLPTVAPRNCLLLPSPSVNNLQQPYDQYFYLTRLFP